VSTNIHIVLLTDGEPDRSNEVLGSFVSQIGPLEAARSQGHHHGVCLSTFGFGYAMNSVSFPVDFTRCQLFAREKTRR
jgi:hypothetical protein